MQRLVGGRFTTWIRAGGNIDHVLIGPGGVFTIETKSHRGRIAAAKVDPAWLKQAYAQSKAVERIIGMKVTPLLVFSRAFVTPAVSHQRGVLVLPARMLAGHLSRRATSLSPAEVERIHRELSDAAHSEEPMGAPHV